MLRFAPGFKICVRSGGGSAYHRVTTSQTVNSGGACTIVCVGTAACLGPRISDCVRRRRTFNGSVGSVLNILNLAPNIATSLVMALVSGPVDSTGARARFFF